MRGEEARLLGIERGGNLDRRGQVGAVAFAQGSHRPGDQAATAQRLRDKQKQQGGDAEPEVQALDFEFVLFASSVVDYDYIMGLIAKMTQVTGATRTMNREQLIGLIASDAKFMGEREDISEYVRGLKAGEGLSEDAIRAGYEQFKGEALLDWTSAPHAPYTVSGVYGAPELKQRGVRIHESFARVVKRGQEIAQGGQGDGRHDGDQDQEAETDTHERGEAAFLGEVGKIFTILASGEGGGQVVGFSGEASFCGCATGPGAGALRAPRLWSSNDCGATTTCRRFMS